MCAFFLSKHFSHGRRVSNLKDMEWFFVLKYTLYVISQHSHLYSVVVVGKAVIW